MTSITRPYTVLYANSVFLNKMISSKNHLRLIFEIEQYKTDSVILCNRCFLFNERCIVMMNFFRLKYFICVKAERSYINLIWKSLNKTRTEYRKKIQNDKKKLSRLINCLFRNKQILKQIDERAKKKMQHLFNEMKKSKLLK